MECILKVVSKELLKLQNWELFKSKFLKHVKMYLQISKMVTV
jgi:hypothetical protein